LKRPTGRLGRLKSEKYAANSQWKGMNSMNEATQRSILRWIHIVFAIPILGYIYSPFKEIPNYAPTRFVFVPVMVLTGLWMWKGHVVRRLFSKRPAQQDAAGNS
jgi:thiosulfate reductase cytochrome b subunit